MKLVVALTVLLGMLASSVHAADMQYVWWEGEDAVEHNFGNRSFAAAGLDKPEELSGGDWLSNGRRQEAEALFATWKIEVPESGRYHFYARKFWHHGPFRWRFDDGAWDELVRTGLLESVPLKLHVTASWVSLGVVDVSAGVHTFEVTLLSKRGDNAVAAFDCFALTRGPWVPAGKRKPGEKSGRALPGYWAFEPDADTFGESPIDLRLMNDAVAGDRGFLKRRGADLVFAMDDEPQRFWGVVTGANCVEMDHASVDYLARRLAKSGVNLVRVHSKVFDEQASDPARIDRDYLDKLQYFVYAMKQQGIYTALSIYFPLWFDVKPGYGLPGYERTDNKKPYSLLFYHPRMQEIYRSWARGLMTTQNPYTGMPLADDPAVAIYEIINEDNFFWYSFKPGDNVPYECLQVLEKEFGAWAAGRYGSLEKAFQTWQHPDERDDAASGRAGLMDAWNLTAAGLRAVPRARRRAQDQARFLTERLRGFYEAMHGWLRSELGVRCPIVATNWKTADPAVLGPLDIYANTACEVLDRHAYWGPPHETDRFYMLAPGDRYRDECGLLSPWNLPVRETEYADRPQMVSEYGFTMPNRFRTDSVPLAAAYGALQGTDIYCFFAVGGPGWDKMLTKWPCMTPAVLGQFPAAALAFRRGYVKEARPVVTQTLDLEQLFLLKGTGEAGSQNLDALRAAEMRDEALEGGSASGRTVQLIHYVGRVLRRFGSPEGEPIDVPEGAIDTQSRVVRSFDGALRLDHGAGVLTVNAPECRAASGFLGKAGRIELGELVVGSGNDYGCVMLVSLDGAPISSSGRMLLQVMTDETNYGWETKASGELVEIVDVGAPPINVRKIAGRVSIRRPDASAIEVTPLDPNGYRLGRDIDPTVLDGSLALNLEPDVLYYYLHVP